MPRERTPLQAAAQRKRDSALRRAREALATMHHAGSEITFQGVADRAGVSRQWLYKNPDLRAEIDKLRATHRGPHSVPAAQRSTDASLRQRNAMLLAENRRLRAENTQLKQELAQLLGERRANPPN
jgi:Family of unknown function (DUF6262)